MTRTVRPLPGHAFHAKSDHELRYIIADATSAARACGQFDERAASKYADQICDASTILNYRAKCLAAATTGKIAEAADRLAAKGQS